MASSPAVSRSVDIHGINVILYGSASKQEKRFWCFICLICGAVMANQMYGIIVEFELHGTGTVIENKPVTRFPTLLYCPDNWINVTLLTNITIKHAVNYLLSILLADPLHMYEQFSARDYNTTDARIETYRESFDTITQTGADLMRRISNNLETESTFVYTAQQFLTASGTCYKLDAVDPVQHLDNMLYITIPQFPPFNGYSTSSIYFGPANIQPFPSGSRILLTPGQHKFAVVQPLLMRRLSKSGHKCRLYSQGERFGCQFHCINEFCAHFNNCLFFTPELFNQTVKQRFCSWLQLATHCGQDLHSRSKHAYSFLRKCDAECLEPCERWSHNVIVQDNPIAINANAGSADTISLALSYSDSRDIMVMSEINMYSWQTLVSNLGGSLSLFFGASIVSLVQIVALVFKQVNHVTTGKMRVRTAIIEVSTTQLK